MAGLVHHNDAGSQSASIASNERLLEAGIDPSVGTVGCRYLIDRAITLGRSVAFGIEGTGSYGAGLALAVRRCATADCGKDNFIEAENAARRRAGRPGNCRPE